MPCIALLLSACTALNQQSASMQNLEQTLADVQRELDATKAALAKQQTTLLYNQASVLSQLEQLQASVNGVPQTVSTLCAKPQQPAQSECRPTVITRTAQTRDDKPLLGEVEYILLDPPGIVVQARMDTGATSSSIHAENIIEFERDGEDWVRFDFVHGPEPITIERKIRRTVRVYQQADKEGSRRYSVALRVVLGTVDGMYEFTLADRAHLEDPVLLGRNFLTDSAIVDVGRQFLQPKPQTDGATSQ